MTEIQDIDLLESQDTFHSDTYCDHRSELISKIYLNVLCIL